MYAGPHTIDLKISDMQGEFGIYNLRVAVCDCSVTENCRARRNTTTRAAYGGIGVVFALVFLLLCKKLHQCLELVSVRTQTCASISVQFLLQTVVFKRVGTLLSASH